MTVFQNKNSHIYLTLSHKYSIISQEDEKNRVWRVAILFWKEAMHMLLEQVYLAFIYILFIELAMVTVVAVALFVALVVTIRKLDNKKNTSLSGQ